MFKKILVPLDGSQLAEQALPYAASLAQKLQAKLLLVQIIEPLNTHSRAESAVVEQSTDYLQAIRNRLSEPYYNTFLPVEQIQISVDYGPVAEQLACLRESEEVDLMIMTTHAHSGMLRLMMGSVASEVATKAGCPVILIHPSTNYHQQSAPQLIPGDSPIELLVAVDGSVVAERMLPTVVEFAKALDATITLIRAYSITVPSVYPAMSGAYAMYFPDDVQKVERQEAREVKEYLTTLQQQLLKQDVRCKSLAVNGVAGFAITQALNEARPGSMAVMTPHLHSRLGEFFLGSTTTSVIRESHLPVMLVYNPPFEETELETIQVDWPQNN